MKSSDRIKLLLLSAFGGASAALCFISAFDVLAMLAFNETNAHPVEFPSMLAVCFVTALIAFVLLFIVIKKILSFVNKKNAFLLSIIVFVASAIVSYLPWCFLLWLFDSDARMID